MLNRILILVTIFAISLFTVSCSKQASESKPYNVLFIAVDDLNDYVSLLNDYPGIQTPNLERLAKQTVTFSRAYCAGPICAPSRAATLTGLAPHITGLYDNEDHWVRSKPAVDATVLPEAFKAAGYTTWWAGKIFHDLSTPSKARLEAMWDETNTNIPGHLWDGSTNLVPYGPSTPDGFGVLEPDEVFADVTNLELAKAFLSQDHDKPFFMAMGIIRPHRPWTAPQRFFDMYPIEDMPMPPGFREDDMNDIPPAGIALAKASGIDYEKLREQGRWKATVQAYLASVSFADESIGKLIDALNDSQYRENTIIVLWGDHGYHMGEKHHLGKWTLWEQGVRNLMMVSVPGMSKKGVKVEQPVSLLDIYPTLLELCHLPDVPQELSGKSLTPFLEDPNLKREEPVLTSYPYKNHGLRDNRFRYIRYDDGSEELYDYRNDNYEWKNVALDPEYADELTRMRQYLPTINAEPVRFVPELEVWREERRKQREHEKTFGTVAQ